MQLSWKQQQVYRGATPPIVSTASGNSSNKDTGGPVWQSCGDESESYLAVAESSKRNPSGRFFTCYKSTVRNTKRLFYGQEILTNGDTYNNNSRYSFTRKKRKIWAKQQKRPKLRTVHLPASFPIAPRFWSTWSTLSRGTQQDQIMPPEHRSTGFAPWNTQDTDRPQSYWLLLYQHFCGIAAEERKSG